MTAATRVLQRNLLVYRRTFRGSIFSSFVTPLFYLTAMGLGLGQLVTRDVSSLPGGDYLAFLGPGIMAASCMQVGRVRVDLPDHGQDHVAPELRGHAGHAHRGASHPGWRAALDRLPDGAHLERLPGRAHPVPDPDLVPRAAGHPRLRAAWRGLLGRDHQLRRHPEERRPASRAISPFRHQSAVPVQRHLLPARARCPIRCGGSSGSRPPRPCITAWRWLRGAVLGDAGHAGRLAVARLPTW